MSAYPDRPCIRGQRVVLRGVVDGDVEARFALGNSAEIQRMFGADPAQLRPITKDAAKAWIDAHGTDPNAWLIEAEGALIGAVRLHSINRADLRAYIAIGLLAEERLGRGYGTEAIQVLAAYVFDALKLHRLTCRVLAFNERAVAAYKKVGFVVEGRERESALIGNIWHDDLILGLLPSDLRRLS